MKTFSTKVHSKTFSISEGRSFAISDKHGINLTKVLLSINSIVYNSNAKIGVPGEPKFLDELIVVAERLKRVSMKQAAVVAKMIFPKDFELAQGAFLKFMSGVANGRNLFSEYSKVSLRNFKVSTFLKMASTGEEISEVTSLGPLKLVNPIYVNNHSYISELRDKRYHKSYNRYYNLLLDLNKLKGDSDIDDVTRSTHIKPLEVEEKELAKKEAKRLEDLKKKIDFKEPSPTLSLRINSSRDVRENLKSDNPYIVSKALSIGLSEGYMKPMEVVKILHGFNEYSRFADIDEFMDIIYSEIYILIPVKEYLKLLKKLD